MVRRWIAVSMVAGLMASPAFALPLLEAKSFLEKTGFTPSVDEAQALSKASYAGAVDLTLAGVTNSLFAPLPSGLLTVTTPPRNPTDAERKKFQQDMRELSGELQVWWLSQMLTTDSPFTERMVLFWHNHFVSSLQKVKHPTLMYQQNQLFRDNALGNFKGLVHAVSRDPAMTLYLDNQTNKKSAPNENCARELMELFTLGEGHYSEADIKKAARAFTGWQVDRRTGEFRFNKRQHDTGEKNFFGQTGRWSGDDIIDLIFEQKGDQVALFLVEKLWREFVSPTVNADEVNRLAELFVEQDFELEPLMRALFQTESFKQSLNANEQIKSPVELLVGTQRMFGLQLANPGLIRNLGRNQGQMLFAPPNVKGWAGGEAWITSATLLSRTETMGRVTRAIADARQKGDDYIETTLLTQSLSEWANYLIGEEAFEFSSRVLRQKNPMTQYDLAITELLKSPAYQLK